MVTALYRYTLACVLHRQSYLAPLLLYAVVVVVGSRGDGGPLLPLYALWTAAMLLCSVALMIIVLRSENIVQERITMVNASHMWSPLVAAVLVALSFDLVLAILGLTFPLLVGIHAADLDDLVVGLAAQVSAACVGSSVGVFCSRLFILRPGYSLLTAASAILVLLLVPWMPVHQLIRLLGSGEAAALMVFTVVVAAVSAIVVLSALLPIAYGLQRLVR